MRFNKSAKQSINNREDIKELSLKYLDKYQPSKKDLRIYLYRKVLDTDYLDKDKESILREIDMVIENLETMGVINDTIYSEIKSKNYLTLIWKESSNLKPCCRQVLLKSEISTKWSKLFSIICLFQVANTANNSI